MTPEEAAQAQLDAYNARDLDAFLGVYAEDCLLVNQGADDILAFGRDQMRPIYEDLFARAPDLSCTLLHRIVHGNFVVDHEEVTGLPNRGTVRTVAIYDVADGLIRRVWFLK